MLLNWLTGSIDKSHYLRLVMTKHDISVIACQMCTCLIAAGVIKQLEGKDMETVFKVGFTFQQLQSCKLKIIPYFFSYKMQLFSFQTIPKILDPSSKMDLDLWDCLGRVNS